MKDWIERRFAKYGLNLHQGRLKAEYDLFPLLHLLEDVGFKVTSKGGSIYSVRHPGLRGSPDFPVGAFQIHRIHPGSKSKPKVRGYFVRDAWRAITYLHQIGVIQNGQNSNGSVLET